MLKAHLHFLHFLLVHEVFASRSFSLFGDRDLELALLLAQCNHPLLTLK